MFIMLICYFIILIYLLISFDSSFDLFFIQNNRTMGWMIAVHAGAGYHSHVNAAKYRRALKMSCEAAERVLVSGGSATDAVVAATSSLENDTLVNAGTGSNLTHDGHVECDASIMSGGGEFGAVGAVQGIRNPISVARRLLEEQKKGLLSLGRIPPMFLVGEGAREWALAHGEEVAESESELLEYNVTEGARRQWSGYRKMLKTHDARVASKVTAAGSAGFKSWLNGDTQEGSRDTEQLRILHPAPSYYMLCAPLTSTR